MAARPGPRWRVLTESPDIAVELSRAASRLGVALEPELCAKPVVDCLSLEALDSVAIATAQPPSRSELAALAEHVSENLSDHHRPLPIALLGVSARRCDFGRDLGLWVIRDVEPLTVALVSARAMEDLGLDAPWLATRRGLSAPDRIRFERALSFTRGQPRTAGELHSGDDGLVVLRKGQQSVVLGPARAAAAALAGRAQLGSSPRPSMPTVDGVDPQAVLDIILGPARKLSDPASKSALNTYDVPFPAEELCSSPSRAAAEATRFGFPVRVALASPDLRIWDHPDLRVDRVGSASQTKEVFRQLSAVAALHDPEARVLGVTVSATKEPTAVVHARLAPIGRNLVELILGFADAHGVASQDEISTVLPCAEHQFRAAVGRLSGCSLLLGSRPPRVPSELADALLRAAAFVHEWRTEVVAVRLHPIAVHLDGTVEVQEACVEVSDAFERTLATG